ncbi:MAG: hypothetical protein QM784_33380 [Polyangiaceae bacterium]
MNPSSVGLEALGWDEAWSTHSSRNERGAICGRVIRAGRLLSVCTGAETILAHCPEGAMDCPVVGDWVTMTVYPDAAEERHRAVIRGVLGAATRSFVGHRRAMVLVPSSPTSTRFRIVCDLD